MVSASNSWNEVCNIRRQIAADIHGKNHCKFGTFRNYIEWLEIIDNDGKIKRCSRDENKELFFGQ